MARGPLLYQSGGACSMRRIALEPTFIAYIAVTSFAGMPADEGAAAVQCSAALQYLK